jgi:hypothetical protein
MFFSTARCELFCHDKPRSGFCDDERSEDVQTQYALLRNAACRAGFHVRLCRDGHRIRKSALHLTLDRRFSGALGGV